MNLLIFNVKFGGELDFDQRVQAVEDSDGSVLNGNDVAVIVADGANDETVAKALEEIVEQFRNYGGQHLFQGAVTNLNPNAHSVDGQPF